MSGRSANWPQHFGVPQPTVYNWVQKGRLRSRFVAAGGGPAKIR